jgi:hypothetical protein
MCIGKEWSFLIPESMLSVLKTLTIYCCSVIDFMTRVLKSLFLMQTRMNTSKETIESARLRAIFFVQNEYLAVN